MVRKRAQLSTERIEKVSNALSIGSTRSAAATAAGVSRSTFYNWIQRGEDMRASLNRGEILGEPTPYELLCMKLVEVIEEHDDSNDVQGRQNAEELPGQTGVVPAANRQQDSTLSEPKRTAKGPQNNRKISPSQNLKGSQEGHKRATESAPKERQKRATPPPPQNTENIDTPRTSRPARSWSDW